MYSACCSWHRVCAAALDQSSLFLPQVAAPNWRHLPDGTAECTRSCRLCLHRTIHFCRSPLPSRAAQPVAMGSAADSATASRCQKIRKSRHQKDGGECRPNHRASDTRKACALARADDIRDIFWSPNNYGKWMRREYVTCFCQLRREVRLTGTAHGLSCTDSFGCCSVHVAVIPAWRIQDNDMGAMAALYN